MELNLRFPEINHVIVKLDEQETDRLPFSSPLSAEDQENICWYLKTYATHHTTDVDDKRAKEIADKLLQWGEDLFNINFSGQCHIAPREHYLKQS